MLNYKLLIIVVSGHNCVAIRRRTDGHAKKRATQIEPISISGAGCIRRRTTTQCVCEHCRRNQRDRLQCRRMSTLFKKSCVRNRSRATEHCSRACWFLCTIHTHTASSYIDGCNMTHVALRCLGICGRYGNYIASRPCASINVQRCMQCEQGFTKHAMQEETQGPKHVLPVCFGPCLHKLRCVHTRLETGLELAVQPVLPVTW